jgi:L-lactate dehydrogenase
MKNKIVIIGCGNVGMSYAYSILNQKTKVNEIVLIDLNQDKIHGEVMDLNHGMPFSPSKINIKAGDYSDCRDAKIVCIAAGANQAPGETRLDLLQKNNKIFEKIVTEVVANDFNGIFLVATNPVDIMTYITYKHSNFPINKVMGSGTTLDTARLRYLIGEKLNINSKNVHAYVMGEHGDSEFIAWSNAYVGSSSIYDYLDENTLIEIGKQVKNAAYEIIKRKGATYYAIGMVLTRITNAILDDENTILTISSYDEKNNIFIGMPTIVNASGASKKISVKLTKEEQDKFNISANIIKNEVEKI